VTKFTLDSNILVYAVDRSARERHESAVEMLARASRRDFVLIPQALAEFFSAATRKRLAPRDLATAQLQDWLDAFPVAAGPTARSVLTAAKATPHFQFFDALLLATAGAAGCSALISEDMHPGAVLGGVRVVAAFDPAGGIAPEARALLGL
jgi:predicted nucleic acid-binding protein